MKAYNVKIYDNSLALIKTFSPRDIRNEISFSSKINGGNGELSLDLIYPFDDIDENGVAAFMNIVTVDMVDGSTIKRIYKGFVQNFEAYSDGAKEGLRLKCLGLTSLLNFAYYKNGTSFSVVHAAQDPSTIIKAIIDHFNTVYGGSIINYTPSSVDNTGLSVSITYSEKKHEASIQNALAISPKDWYWKVDANGLFTFKEKSSVADHRFTIGKDIQKITISKSSDNVVNEVTVKYASGGITTQSNAPSQIAFGISGSGKRSLIISDTQIQDLTSADQRANAELDRNEAETVKIQIVINSKFDFEDIEVGDTCVIQNYKAEGISIPNPLKIIKINYSPIFCTLEMEDELSNLTTELQSLIKATAVTGTGGTDGTDGVDGADGFGVLVSRTITSNTTVISTDQIIYADATSGSIVLTLPTASTVTGQPFMIVRMNSGANTVTVQGTGGETINGSATVVLNQQYDAPTLVARTSDYIIAF